MRTSRTRGLAFLVASAIAATLFGVAPAPAEPISPVSCAVRQGFTWCGEHWRWADLPIAVYANKSNLPSGVTEPEFVGAVKGAVAAWETPATALPRIPPSGLCPPGTRVLCFKGTNTIGEAPDGVTVVRFATWAGMSLGKTRWCFTGPICPESGMQLKDADVTLRWPGVSWHQATPAEVAVGEIGGPFGPYRCFAPICPTWYDLQSIITHELGHVLGLGEAEGDIAGCEPTVEDSEWAGDLTDAVNFMQTMYPCHWKGLTNRRTIDAGDFAGLVAVLLGPRLDS